eukprot:6201027-Pleurochrysis_carterae.AAC.1
MEMTHGCFVDTVICDGSFGCGRRESAPVTRTHTRAHALRQSPSASRVSCTSKSLESHWYL